jgi:molybdenum cofactor synthesis domain-containing protein
MRSVGVLTISTSGFHGAREDTSGRAISELLSVPDYQQVRYEVVPDDGEMIADRLASWSDSGEVDLIVTTGGTGLSPRDVTPEAVETVIERPVPGLAEAMRAGTLSKTPMAMLSRSVAGIRGHTLIVTLPGSPRGVTECLEIIMPVLGHALDILQEQTSDHPTGH